MSIPRIENPAVCSAEAPEDGVHPHPAPCDSTVHELASEDGGQVLSLRYGTRHRPEPPLDGFLLHRGPSARGGLEGPAGTASLAQRRPKCTMDYPAKGTGEGAPEVNVAPQKKRNSVQMLYGTEEGATGPAFDAATCAVASQRFLSNST